MNTLIGHEADNAPADTVAHQKASWFSRQHEVARLCHRLGDCTGGLRGVVGKGGRPV